jgi:hypothetical protein
MSSTTGFPDYDNRKPQGRFGAPRGPNGKFLPSTSKPRSSPAKKTVKSSSSSSKSKSRVRVSSDLRAKYEGKEGTAKRRVQSLQKAIEKWQTKADDYDEKIEALEENIKAADKEIKQLLGMFGRALLK